MNKITCFILGVLYLPLALFAEDYVFQPQVMNYLEATESEVNSESTSDLEVLNYGHSGVYTEFSKDDDGVTSSHVGSDQICLDYIEIGSTFSSTAFDYKFGEDITPPLIDLDGKPLDLAGAKAYWRAKPYVTGEPLLVDENSQDIKKSSSGSTYYYSIHSETVYASQAGNIYITWVKAKPNTDGEYSLKKTFYTVDSESDLPSRNIYWTEHGFEAPEATVPTGTVADINLVYHSNFAETVSEEERYIPTGLDSAIVTTNTTWYDSSIQKIRSFNVEGKLLIEYLGARIGETEQREQIAMEVLHVQQEMTRIVAHTHIGDQHQPVISSNDGVSIVPNNHESFAAQASDDTLAYGLTESHFIGGKETYYAINQNSIAYRVELYWTEEDPSTGIIWPAIRNVYTQDWPEDLADYGALFLHTNSGSDDANVNIKFPQVVAPEIIYQDGFSQTVANLDTETQFTVTLDRSAEVGIQRNRSVIRMTDGVEYWYLRVYTGSVDHFAGLNLNNSLLDTSDIYRSGDIAKVGDRIERPSTDYEVAGYIDPDYSSFYNIEAYIDPFENGFAAAGLGSIIPVNAFKKDGRNESAPKVDEELKSRTEKLRVWWSKTIDTPAGSTAFGELKITVPSLFLDYTLEYPEKDGELDMSEIVLASNLGSGDLDSNVAAGTLYQQNDPKLPGYNPNEEHALITGGVAYALRDDLNRENISSEPVVMITYSDPDDGRPRMQLYQVKRTSEDYTFTYSATAGKVLQAPMPLPLLPQPIFETEVGDVSANKEISTVDNSDSNGESHYELFTFEDRKGAKWLYRGVHETDSDNKTFGMQYYYVNQEQFSYPDENGINQAPVSPTEGGMAIVPYLRPELDGGGYDGGYNTAHNEVVADETTIQSQLITIAPQWPEYAPVMRTAETLALPKFGLPQIRGQQSVQILYQQSLEKDGTESVILHDPTVEKTYNLLGANSNSRDGLKTIPKTIATETSLGKTYFTQLPNHLIDRVYVDTTRSSHGTLILAGVFNDELVGEDYFLPNILTAKDIKSLKDICPADDEDKAEWDSVIEDGLQVTLSKFVESRDIPGTYVTIEKEYGSEFEKAPSLEEEFGSNTYKAADIVKLSSPPVITGLSTSTGLNTEGRLEKTFYDEAVDSHALTAVGGGTGYVTIVTGNGQAVFTDQENPVQMFIFKVTPDLYTGEVKPITASNPLSEKMVMNFTGDFAAHQEDYEFDWRRANPVNGLMPALYKYSYNKYNGLSQATWKADTGDEFLLPQKFAVSVDTVDTESDIELTELSTDHPGVSAFNNSNIESIYIGLKYGLNDNVKVLLQGQVVLDTAEDSAVTPPTEGGLADHFSDSRNVYLLNKSDFVNLEDVSTMTLQFSTSTKEEQVEEVDLRLAAKLRTSIVESNYEKVTLSSDETVQGKVRHFVAGSGVEILSDNYYTMRYRPNGGDDNSWSDWTQPSLAEGWIKRVLAGINPFNQTIDNFLEGEVSTTTSLLAQAGTRWEGDIALNLDAVNNSGLIEVYETVLRRGMDLSINAIPEGINFGPANDALLLAAGYLSDLYQAVGDEAYSDASDPTVILDTQPLSNFGELSYDSVFSSATSRFSFQGQVSSLLDEELGLLRGRDDFLSPSIQTPPVYNRLFWNYTRGIDAGELVYALNYNISDVNDTSNSGEADGSIGAEDAATLYPQAHGDAYGHYLTAVKNYYRLLTDEHFTWQPRIEAVTILGQPVSVDYLDERKFASGASQLIKTAQQIISLQRRKNYRDNNTAGWSNTRDDKVNSATGTTRRWGVDDWATRAGQGAYFHWVVANSILPAEDTENEGIQKIDRTTVPELATIASGAAEIQNQLNGIDQRINPLDLNENSMVFDVSPAGLKEDETHFLQVYASAVKALENASSVFARATAASKRLRFTEQQSASLDQTLIDTEEAYNDQLIEIFGRPYSGDIGPGKLYAQGYVGPDINNFNKITREIEFDSFYEYEEGVKEFTFNDEDEFLTTLFGGKNLSDEDLAKLISDNRDFYKNTILNNSIMSESEFNDLSDKAFIAKIKGSLSTLLVDFYGNYDFNKTVSDPALSLSAYASLGFEPNAGEVTSSENISYDDSKSILRNLDELYKARKQRTYTLAGGVTYYALADSSTDGERPRLGTLQTTLHEMRLAEEALYGALKQMEEASEGVSDELKELEEALVAGDIEYAFNTATELGTHIYESALQYKELIGTIRAATKKAIDAKVKAVVDAMPKVAGMSNDVLAPLRAKVLTIATTKKVTDAATEAATAAKFTLAGQLLTDLQFSFAQYVGRNERMEEVVSQAKEVGGMIESTWDYNKVADDAAVAYARAIEKYRTEVARGYALLDERASYRQRAAAGIQGYRSRDVAFRLFRSEALEEYQRMYEWAAKYVFLAAQAYDYETGLLGSTNGQDYIGDIIGSRALGLIEQGEPQVTSSSDGDEGLAGLLAKLKVDYDSVHSRLGFNNPETYGTTFSLRREYFRIPDGEEGDKLWKQKLESLVVENLLSDADVGTHALQIEAGNNTAIPGLLLNFPTTIESGKNFFGNPLEAGDSKYTESSFSTKISSVGVILDGYLGMAPCVVCPITGEPTYNEDDALGATPHLYLLPTGRDSMRIPIQSGSGESEIRNWNVEDYALPLPFDLGASEESDAKSADLLAEFRSPRKHLAFRGTDEVGRFYSGYEADYTSSRLIGRSVWNSNWKLVIPAKELLSDESEGMSRFINSVKDIKLHLKTYSYAGN